MSAHAQYHELLWREFAIRQRLSLQRDENGFYVNPKTREAHSAWITRSKIEITSCAPRAYHNAALCLASTEAYEIIIKRDKALAVMVAAAIQALRIKE